MTGKYWPIKQPSRDIKNETKTDTKSAFNLPRVLKGTIDDRLS